MEKFNFKIYTCSKDDFTGSDYYEMTLEDMTKKCCILDGVLCWEESIPSHRNWDVQVQFPGFYDIWNYECFPWYDCPRLTEKCQEAAKEKGHYAKDEWCEEHEQVMWKNGLMCGGCLDKKEIYEKNKQDILDKMSELKKEIAASK